MQVSSLFLPQTLNLSFVECFLYRFGTIWALLKSLTSFHSLACNTMVSHEKSSQTRWYEGWRFFSDFYFIWLLRKSFIVICYYSCRFVIEVSQNYILISRITMCLFCRCVSAICWYCRQKNIRVFVPCLFSFSCSSVSSTRMLYSFARSSCILCFSLISGSFFLSKFFQLFGFLLKPQRLLRDLLYIQVIYQSLGLSVCCSFDQKVKTKI